LCTLQAQTVQWATCLEACVEAGALAFLELGPGRALAEMAASAYPAIVSREVVYESWILARFTRTQLTTADNRAG
jgi:malonyl CoA-acyl carrier protein transacylase